MGEKQIVLPLSGKMILLESLRNYMSLIGRRIEAEKFATVKAELSKSRNDVQALLVEVERF